MNVLISKIKNNPWKTGLIGFLLCSYFWGVAPFIIINSFFGVIAAVFLICGTAKAIFDFIKEIIKI